LLVSVPVTTKPLFEVRDSPIAGKGMFALRKIKKGTVIMEYVGEKIDKREAKAREKSGLDTYIFYLDRYHDLDGIHGNESKFVNHSCDNNVRVSVRGGKIFYVAVRTISSSEEITADYELISDKLEKCSCGALNCRGYMNEKSFLKKFQKKKHLSRK